MFVINPLLHHQSSEVSAFGSSETTVNFYQTKRRHTQEDSNLLKYPSSECTNLQAVLGCDVTCTVLTPLVHIMVCVM
jgi:hypothetical protein